VNAVSQTRFRPLSPAQDPTVVDQCKVKNPVTLLAQRREGLDLVRQRRDEEDCLMLLEISVHIKSRWVGLMLDS
jgi:hypothetical protein